ncbi:hypothetical protein [Qipengyuania sphaerica]|uniref:hypothetical protein n=1 Tax=Qipengyuania sphaerica TaxID=2867243 RepID=UPI001C887945|nr:hypothetical protein [Qipengyuania sphaerica]MBX7540578.1 hypothetical protein [Qipengyuania sphaerica]
MKKLLIIAACASLAACGSNEAEQTAEPVDTTAGQTDTATADQMAGTYEITLEDGTVVRQTINTDGTYVDTTLDGTETERGTWRQQGEQMCFDPEGDGAEACYTGGAPGADGSFEVRDASGNVSSSVRRIED